MENAKGGIKQLRPKTKDQIPEMPLDYFKLPPSPFGTKIDEFKNIKKFTPWNVQLFHLGPAPPALLVICNA